MNLTIGAWNFIAPKASNSLNFAGDMIKKGYNYVTSAFDMDFDDIDFDLSQEEIYKNLEYGQYDVYESQQELNEEYEEVKAIIDAGY